MTTETFYITTPIYYVNGKPHIGHAYTTIACDAIARFQRLMGREVKFLTGTDEHGQKVQKAAMDAGITPQEYADNVAAVFHELLGLIDVTNTDFIRTTEARHKACVQDIWQRMEANGHIYLDKYSGWYAVRDEAYYQESELTTGPDGQKIAPTGAPVEWVEEESYFFRLSAFQEKLLAHYDANPDFIQPQSRKNEVVSFVKGGAERVDGHLKDLSISRTTFDWGVPVPGNDKHVMYVWLDALANYLTSCGWPDADAADMKFWPANIHMVGKDILRFHAVYWPAFLMAADLPLPKQVFAHGWWMVKGEKMSKSLGNVVDPVELIDRLGSDALRYFLLSDVRFGQDGDISEEAILKRVNGELANEFGNLAQRVLSMVFKNCDGALAAAPGGALAAPTAVAEVVEQLDKVAFDRALESIWAVVRNANAWMDEQAPWALKKTDPVKMGTVLAELAEAIRVLAIVMQPFTPKGCKVILDTLNIPEDQRLYKHASADFALKAGHSINQPVGAFPRYNPPEAAAE